MVAEDELSKEEKIDSELDQKRTAVERIFFLKYEADLRTLFFVGSYFMLTSFMWNQHGVLHPLVAVPLWLAMTILSFIGAVITHNSMHCPVFTSRFLNRIFQIILTLTYGHPVSSYVPGHNLSHHKFTQQKKDVMRTTKVHYKWNFINFLMFQPRIAPDMLKNDFRYIYLQGKLGRSIWRQSIMEFAILLAVQGYLVYLSPALFMLYFWVPHFFAQWAIVTMNLLQHDGCDKNMKGYNFARNFVGEKINFFFLNNGFHTLHHMRPGVHWSKLPELHQKLVHPFIHPNLEQEYFFGYIWTTFFWPGQRLRYDGSPLELDDTELGPDEEWIVVPPALRALEEQQKSSS